MEGEGKSLGFGENEVVVVVRGAWGHVLLTLHSSVGAAGGLVASLWGSGQGASIHSSCGSLLLAAGSGRGQQRGIKV